MDSKNHDSSDVLTAVLDNIAESMVVIGPDFRVRAFNQRFVDLFQLPAKAFQMGIDFQEVLCIWAAETGQDQAMLERAIRELSMPESFVFEFAQDIHGEERWCQLFHNPLPEGGCVRTFSDITDQRKTEESVRRQKNLLSAVLSNMAQGVVDSQVEVGRASGEAVGCPCSRRIRGSHVDLPQGDAELDWYRKIGGRRKVVGATLGAQIVIEDYNILLIHEVIRDNCMGRNRSHTKRPVSTSSRIVTAARHIAPVIMHPQQSRRDPTNSTSNWFMPGSDSCGSQAQGWHSTLLRIILIKGAQKPTIVNLSRKRGFCGRPESPCTRP